MVTKPFYNQILATIGAESVTDDEWATVEATADLYDQQTYDDLFRILSVRGAFSTTLDRLNAYYVLQGASFSATGKIAQSNILIGIPL